MNTNQQGNSGQGNRDSQSLNQDSERMDGRGNPQRFEDNKQNAPEDYAAGSRDNSDNNDSFESQQSGSRDNADRRLEDRDPDGANSRFSSDEFDENQAQHGETGRQNDLTGNSSNFSQTNDEDFTTQTANFQDDEDDEDDDDDDFLDSDFDEDDDNLDENEDIRPDRNL